MCGQIHINIHPSSSIWEISWLNIKGLTCMFSSFFFISIILRNHSSWVLRKAFEWSLKFNMHKDFSDWLSILSISLHYVVRLQHNIPMPIHQYAPFNTHDMIWCISYSNMKIMNHSLKNMRPDCSGLEIGTFSYHGHFQWKQYKYTKLCLALSRGWGHFPS